jgi:hypothetical protein
MRTETHNLIIKSAVDISVVEADGEPLDGDEVREIVESFAKELCEMNGEYDQVKEIIRRDK